MSVPHIAPMTAVSGELPTDDQNWMIEPKWDGMRVLLEIDHGAVAARSRTGKDALAQFPELAGLASLGPTTLVLDGEIVALDDDGRSSFSRLQGRFGRVDPREVETLAHEMPAEYVVFDLLHLDGLDAWRLPFAQRRELLESLVDDGPTWRRTPSSVGDGQLWLDAAREHSLEGIMAKRVDRPYEPGKRSPSWRKVKLRHEQEFAVCGWTPGTGRREGGIGALVLACREQDRWHWVGNVGTGLRDADLDWWLAELSRDEVDESPLGDGRRDRALRLARWATPRHVVQVAYAEWTNDRHLRQPSLLGRRIDVDVMTVRCDE
ncbi:hypothetical protein BH10ACT3_BH10ACT3_04510 [soil metagenome]